MKQFFSNFALTLIAVFVFAFFGGFSFFSLQRHIFRAIVGIAFLAALILHGFLSQSEKIDQMEKRIVELEETISQKKQTEQNEL